MSEINWIAIADDDFKAEPHDYMLRAEQMDEDAWWEVYFKGDAIMGHCHYMPETEEQAKAFAEMVYFAHKKALRIKS